MKSNLKIAVSVLCASLSGAVFAEPGANVIIQDKRAEVPVTKTQVITTSEGKVPVRKTATTVLELKENSQDVIAKEVEQVDHNAEFAAEKMAIPHVEEKSAIVPTTKIVEQAVVSREGEVVGEVRKVQASGLQYQEGKAPVRKELQVGSVATAEGKAARAVVNSDGKTTRDVSVVAPAEEAK
ncbi:hypothetical protein EC844_101356 [Acinetobacter calcoaceticus]|uniref:Uncharacterized protein n=1 Tax=Acinetobacter calcoaceticus TaxID=471 RepID=A0A4R1Y1T7_ACICA|nr:hypothetical protein EC844_101356 [Acinetobacter calcoaceticus]